MKQLGAHAIKGTPMAALLAITIMATGHAQTARHMQTRSSRGSGVKSVLDCAAGQAEIAGSNNILTINGDCKKLEVLGSNNAIMVALAESAEVQLVGSNNKIIWTTPNGPSPSIQQLGSGNTVSKGGWPESVCSRNAGCEAPSARLGWAQLAGIFGKRSLSPPSCTQGWALSQ
jgi:hypothetical protein